MSEDFFVIEGVVDGRRVESRVLEERIQEAVASGHRHLMVRAYGQHGIGGRLYGAGKETVVVKIEGQSGQRVGSFGFPNTRIEIFGPASDDVGWLNAGAQIVIHGDAANGTANAMAQGKIYIGGNIGARGMTMTKHNPRFDQPELWVLGSAGDYFGEFMAGGVAVICGHGSRNSDNVLGYRPLVGMVGGTVFFRGPDQAFSKQDAKMLPITDEDWTWLLKNTKIFLELIGKPELLEELAERNEWRQIRVRTPQEKVAAGLRAMTDFRRDVWDRELGQGGVTGDLTHLDMTPIPLITTGELRRHVPVWENRKYLAPCEASCPAGIPVHERWRLIREGSVDEAVDLALAYTPFPAAVCGYLCPNLCMQSCTRNRASMPVIDVARLGQASINAQAKKPPALTGKKIAVIGGGPAGLSVAWQLRMVGHDVIIHDVSEKLGGKITAVIPESRIPQNVVDAELRRASEIVPQVRLGKRIEKQDVERLKREFDFVVIASGAQKPGSLPVPGNEKAMSALEFLTQAKSGTVTPGKNVVIIGAGNVGCDVASEAHRLGAESITLLDIQEPASFGKERAHAEAAGAKFRWPVFTREITDEGVVLKTGEVVPADTVVISIGDKPDLGFLPDSVETERGFIRVDDNHRTSDLQIFAIGDAVKPGLLTDAIGAGRKAARAISGMISGRPPEKDTRKMIDRDRVTLEYFDPRLTAFDDVRQCSSQCASCGTCRDCGICVNVCPNAAISRKDLPNHTYEYTVDDTKCIGCGFCAGACPCGVWDLAENFQMA